MNKLSNIAVRDVKRITQQNRIEQGRAKHTASAAINRNKKQTAIEKQNAAFAKRLAGIKSTTTVSRKNLQQHANKQQRLAANVRQFRGDTFGARPASRSSSSSRLRDTVSGASAYDHLF